MKSNSKYIALLRGINVGGHHKVSMAELKEELERQGFSNVETLLNSGNAIFESVSVPKANRMAEEFEKRFGFPVPTVVVDAGTIQELLANNPFEGIRVTKDTRLYVSFLWIDQAGAPALPFVSQDGSFQILEKRGALIFSVLDMSKTKTPKAMAALEQSYGKHLTTRNWNTVERLGKKL